MEELQARSKHRVLHAAVLVRECLPSHTATPPQFERFSVTDYKVSVGVDTVLIAVLVVVQIMMIRMS